MKKMTIFYLFLCIAFPSVNAAAPFDEQAFLRNVALKKRKLKDRLSDVINPAARAEIYDQLIKDEVKGPAKGLDGAILHVWAEGLFQQENPEVIEITMNKLSRRMGGVRQDILSSIAVVIAAAPGTIYVPDEVINMLQIVGMWKSDYKKKLRQGAPLSDNSEGCYYALLSLSYGASSEEIKKAYRRAAMKFHPDRNPGDLIAEEKFKRRKEAYETLSNPNSRRTYDRRHGIL